MLGLSKTLDNFTILNVSLFTKVGPWWISSVHLMAIQHLGTFSEPLWTQIFCHIFQSNPWNSEILVRRRHANNTTLIIIPHGNNGQNGFRTHTAYVMVRLRDSVNISIWWIETPKINELKTFDANKPTFRIDLCVFDWSRVERFVSGYDGYNVTFG